MTSNSPEDTILWNQPLGMEPQKEMLAAALERDRLAHTLLFHGERENGSEALAIHLMRQLLCNETGVAPCEHCPNCLKTRSLSHPDLMVVFPLPSGGDSGNGSDKAREQYSEQIRRETTGKAANLYHRMEVENGRAILLDQIRSVRRFAGMKSYEGGNRVILLFDAHLMNRNAQNALLKLAEEPPANLYLLLVTDQPSTLLPTIVSRCQSLLVPPQPAATITAALTAAGTPETEAAVIARLADGSPGRAIRMLQAEKETLQEAIDFLRLVLGNDSAALAARLSELTRNRDRDGCRRLFRQLLTWFRDLQIMAAAPTGSNWIRHAEAGETLSRFAEAYVVEPVGEMITLLEEYIDRLEKNLYLNNLLFTLVFDLRRRIRRRQRA